MAVETAVEVTMPAMGDSVTEGTVLEWHKSEGDSVAVDDALVEISTDKVDAEVPSPVAGTITKIHVPDGDTITVGSVLCEILPGEGAAPATNGSGGGEAGGEASGRDRRSATVEAPSEE